MSGSWRCAGKIRTPPALASMRNASLPLNCALPVLPSEKQFKNLIMPTLRSTEGYANRNCAIGAKALFRLEEETQHSDEFRARPRILESSYLWKTVHPPPRLSCGLERLETRITCDGSVTYLCLKYAVEVSTRDALETRKIATVELHTFTSWITTAVEVDTHRAWAVKTQ